MDLKGFSTGVCPCKATQSHDVNGEPLVPNFSEISQRGADELLQYTTRYYWAAKKKFKFEQIINNIMVKKMTILLLL